MELKTRVVAEKGTQEVLITRIFELPVALLFRAYTEAELIEQWMGNKVIKMENKMHGGYCFETKDEVGNVLFRAHGSIHSITGNQNITRTFEMESKAFPVQLEFLDFEAIDATTSRLSMKIVFRSETDRDNLLKLPFVQGINMAHHQLQRVLQKIQNTTA